MWQKYSRLCFFFLANAIGVWFATSCGGSQKSSSPSFPSSPSSPHSKTSFDSESKKNNFSLGRNDVSSFSSVLDVIPIHRDWMLYVDGKKLRRTSLYPIFIALLKQHHYDRLLSALEKSCGFPFQHAVEELAASHSSGGLLLAMHLSVTSDEARECIEKRYKKVNTNTAGNAGGNAGSSSGEKKDGSESLNPIDFFTPFQIVSRKNLLLVGDKIMFSNLDMSPSTPMMGSHFFSSHVDDLEKDKEKKNDPQQILTFSAEFSEAPFRHLELNIYAAQTSFQLEAKVELDDEKSAEMFVDYVQNALKKHKFTQSHLAKEVWSSIKLEGLQNKVYISLKSEGSPRVQANYAEVITELALQFIKSYRGSSSPNVEP